jgi:hypothetical protein
MIAVLLLLLDVPNLVSPGPLARPHAALDRQCDKCHVPFKGIPAANCLACHAHTAAELQAHKGFHANLADRKCSSCHRDHKGRDHQLSPPIEPGGFDHATTSFPLDGKHRGVPCAKCHANDKWVGVAATCAGCHADDHHKGALGRECASCHTAADWKTPRKTIADHKVPMNGKHVGLACAKCHDRGAHLAATTTCADCHAQKTKHGATKTTCASCHNAEDWKKASFTHDFCTCILPGKHQTAPCLSCHPNFLFKPTPFACAACHTKDRKHEELGACARCHSALSWKQKTFDHNKKQFGFPLTGKHLEVGCENCHKTKGVFTGLETRCESCHKTPKHGDFGACAPCHTTTAWIPSPFSHAKTRFALEQAHLRVPCEKCHSQFKKTERVPDCADCHKDPHQGQFQRARAQRATGVVLAAFVQHEVSARPCADCHTTQSWKPSTITPANHAQLGFELKASHQQVACARCHIEGKFVGTPKPCAECHMSPHGATLASACEKCHRETNWRDTPSFDHAAATGFAIVGAHKGLSCATCHGTRHEKLIGVARPVGCAACHTPLHGRQFGTDCTSCHKETQFSDVPPFAHAQKTVFPLERRHAALRCTSCHDARRGERLSAACQSCHGDPHRGATGTSCGDCHRPDRWLLVRFDHDRTAFPLRGRHFATPCADCHRNNLFTGLRTECVTCHARNRPMEHGARWDCGTAGCHVPFDWRLGH